MCEGVVCVRLSLSSHTHTHTHKSHKLVGGPDLVCGFVVRARDVLRHAVCDTFSFAHMHFFSFSSFKWVGLRGRPGDSSRLA